MPSQKLLAVSRTLRKYAPTEPGGCLWRVTFSDKGVSAYQLEVKSNLSPVSRMFRSVRRAKRKSPKAPQAKKSTDSPVCTFGRCTNTSIQTATKSTPAKLIGTRYFQHMFII